MLWLDHINNIFDWQTLHKTYKEALYALACGSSKLSQERIDEEGCGAVFASACLTPV